MSLACPGTEEPSPVAAQDWLGKLGVVYVTSKHEEIID